MIPPTHQKSFERSAGTIPKKWAPTMKAMTGIKYSVRPVRLSNATEIKIATASSVTKIP
jgi:hypothetical protein